MDKAQIFAVVKKHMIDALDDIDGDKISLDHSMAEHYGATSLDMVSVVSGTMRELKIKIPRTAIKDIKTIGELVELFEQNA